MKKKDKITAEAIRVAPYALTYKEYAEKVACGQLANRYNTHKKLKENQKNV